MLAHGRNRHPNPTDSAGFRCSDDFAATEALSTNRPSHFRYQARIDGLARLSAHDHPAFPGGSDALTVRGGMDFIGAVGCSYGCAVFQFEEWNKTRISLLYRYGHPKETVRNGFVVGRSGAWPGYEG